MKVLFIFLLITILSVSGLAQQAVPNLQVRSDRELSQYIQGSKLEKISRESLLMSAKRISKEEIEQKKNQNKSFRDGSSLSFGNEGGHGGNIYSSEFFSIGLILVSILIDNKELNQGYGIDIELLKETIEKARIVSAEPKDMILKGFEEHAINFPTSQVIKVNIKTWRRLNLEQKMLLVFHEYLGLMGVELDHYRTSGKLRLLISQIANTVSQDPDFRSLNANLFYGQCSMGVALADVVICNQNDPRFKQTVSCAQMEAEGQCRANGNSDCQQVSMLAKEKIDNKIIGLRLCEVEVILR